MKEILITVSDIEKYMGIDNYRKFVDEINKRFKKQFKRSLTGFWIIAQQLEEKDKF